MKKIISVSLSGLFFASAVLAAYTPEGPPGGDVDILQIINNIVNWVFAIFLGMSALFIILAAFQFLTAGGDSSKVSAARDKMLYAAVGIAVAMLSRAITPIVRNILNL